MTNDLWEKATQLARRNYTVVITKNQLTSGEYVFIAENPELNGCKSQGNSIVDALLNLDDARIDFIHSLLEDGLSVPTPQKPSITGTMVEATFFITGVGDTLRQENTKPLNKENPEGIFVRVELATVK